MTANYHTDIAGGAAANAATFNAPLGQLDSAITNALTGVQAFTQINFGTDTTVTISVGVITVSQTRHLVDTEGASVTDDLDTISGGSEGDLLILQSVSASRVVVVKHNTGNIYLRSGSHVELRDPYHALVLMYDGAKWVEPNGNKITVGIEAALTISGGVITVTRPKHILDTEAAAATDDLDSINGGADGDMVVLVPTSAARVIVVKHGTGNIRLFNGLDMPLDATHKQLMLVYDGGLWCEINAGVALKALTYNGFKKFRDVPVAYNYAGRNNWSVKAAAAIVQQNGIAAPTLTAGTASASNDTDSTYINLLTGAVSGNIAGYVTATFNLVRRSHNPVFHFLMRTGAAADIAAIRFWIGLFSAAPTNVDAIAAGTSAVAFRYSTVAGDAGWLPVTNDGATQSTATAIGTIAASTRYLLSIEVDDTNGIAYFMVNNDLTTRRSINTNLPAAATELGAAWYLITNSGAGKNFKFSRAWCDYD